MKIIYCTLHDLDYSEPNYGNRLQSYATMFILSRVYEGTNVSQIIYENGPIRMKNTIKYYMHYLSIFRFAKDRGFWYRYGKTISFQRFEKEKFSYVKCVNLNQVPTADKYCVGSDQVWNAKWYEKDGIKKDLFLLTFAKPEQKICISPSFGTDSIPDEWKDWFKQHLATFPTLAVREESGARIIKELTGRDAEVLIDPTLMLDAEDWRKITRPNKKVSRKKPYIFTYFLGGVTAQAQADIDVLNKDGRYNVYHAMDMNNIDLYAMDPGQFVYMIEHADIILTDSFHACVFSFLFDKPFLVYSREGAENNMFSRMETLFIKFDLARKYRQNGIELDVANVFEHDYSAGKAALGRERSKFSSYLKNCLKMGQENEDRTN